MMLINISNEQIKSHFGCTYYLCYIIQGMLLNTIWYECIILECTGKNYYMYKYIGYSTLYGNIVLEHRSIRNYLGCLEFKITLSVNWVKNIYNFNKIGTKKKSNYRKRKMMKEHAMNIVQFSYMIHVLTFSSFFIFLWFWGARFFLIFVFLQIIWIIQLLQPVSCIGMHL